MGKSIIVIDDEVDSCNLLKSYLTQLKYDVHVAFTLHDGLALINEIHPSVIFLDNNLPDGLGWESIEKIQSIVPDCQINLISAYSNRFAMDNEKNIRIIEKPISLRKINEFLSAASA